MPLRRSWIQQLGPAVLMSHLGACVALSPVWLWLLYQVYQEWSRSGLEYLVSLVWTVMLMACLVHFLSLPGFFAGWIALIGPPSRKAECFAVRIAFLTSLGSGLVMFGLIYLAWAG